MKKRRRQIEAQPKPDAQPPAPPRPLTEAERAELATYEERVRTRPCPPRAHATGAASRFARRHQAAR